MLVKALGFGAGFALVCVAAVAIWIWHSSRPKPPVPWNTQAITATYNYITTAGDQKRIAFVYTLQNNTKEDYRLDSNSNTDLAVRLLKENSIHAMKSEDQKIEFPVFVPVNGRTTFYFEIPYEYTGKKSDEEDSKQHHANVQAFVKEHYKNLNGFVLFDHTHRYQIEMPKGW